MKFKCCHTGLVRFISLLWLREVPFLGQMFTLPNKIWVCWEFHAADCLASFCSVSLFTGLNLSLNVTWVVSFWALFQGVKLLVTVACDLSIWRTMIRVFSDSVLILLWRKGIVLLNLLARGFETVLFITFLLNYSQFYLGGQCLSCLIHCIIGLWGFLLGNFLSLHDSPISCVQEYFFLVFFVENFLFLVFLLKTTYFWFSWWKLLSIYKHCF